MVPDPRPADEVNRMLDITTTMIENIQTNLQKSSSYNVFAGTVQFKAEAEVHENPGTSNAGTPNPGSPNAETTIGEEFQVKKEHEEIEEAQEIHTEHVEDDQIEDENVEQADDPNAAFIEDKEPDESQNQKRKLAKDESEPSNETPGKT